MQRFFLAVIFIFLQLTPVVARDVETYNNEVDTPERQTTNKDVVLIRTSTGNGSGVIVSRLGSIYTVVTAAHVVKGRGIPGEIVTFDDERHFIGLKNIKTLKGTDIAVITFMSDRDYPVSKIGDLPSREQVVNLVGFPLGDMRKSTGKIIAVSNKEQPGGYNLLIGNTAIEPGMSGGGIYNKDGDLVAISSISIGSNFTSNGVSGMAIPIRRFLRVNNNVTILHDSEMDVSFSLDTSDDYFVSGQIDQIRQKHLAAIAAFDRALEIEPGHKRIYYRRGLSRNLVGDKTGAIEDFNQSIVFFPMDSAAYSIRGNIKGELGDSVGAVSDCGKAIKLSPKDFRAYVCRGIARADKQKKLALKDFDTALSINSQYSLAYLSRARVKRSLGDYDGALLDYDQALFLSPSDDVKQEQLVLLNMMGSN